MTSYLCRLLLFILFASWMCEADTPVEILKRARRGDRIAMRQIGRRLIQGDGVPREVSSGIGWLEKAADEGDDVAMLMLGDIYRNGIGVSRNMRKAIRYYEQAESAGSEVAVRRLEKYRPDPDKKRRVSHERNSDSVERSEKRSRSASSRGEAKRSREENGVQDDGVDEPLEAEMADAGRVNRRAAESGGDVDLGRKGKYGEKRAEPKDEDAHLATTQRQARQQLTARGIPESAYSQRAVEAAEKGDVALLQLLIEAGVPFNERGSTGLMHVAAQNGQTKTVAYLIAKGAKVYATNAAGQTPLHLAAAHGKAEVVELLLKAGGRVGVFDNQGCTPLHAAVRGGNAEIVNRLIMAGGKVDAISCEGKTPLHLAAESGSVELTQLLISAGANVNHVNSKQHQTVLETAADNKHWDVYEVLRQAGAQK